MLVGADGSAGGTGALCVTAVEMIVVELSVVRSVQTNGIIL
jgi:hypothetical protein